jgi:hypothetical protein
MYLRDNEGNIVHDKNGNPVFMENTVLVEGKLIPLAPCPFCGERVVAIKRGNSVSYYLISCPPCRVEVKGTRLVDAVSTWNRRV